MLRDPLDFRASNFAIIVCGLNYEVNRFNNERVGKGLERVCTPLSWAMSQNVAKMSPRHVICLQFDDVTGFITTFGDV